MLKEPFEMCFRHEELVWHFFLDQEDRLCYRNSPKEKKEWSEPSVLQPNYGGQFVVSLSSEKQFHVAATDEENRIWYHHYISQKWNSRIVAEEHPLAEVNGMSLTMDSHQKIHLLYSLRTGRKKGEWQITHNFFDCTKWHSFILDKGIGLAEAKTSAAVDNDNNLHLIYPAPSLNDSPLLHQIFETSEKQWRKQEQIPVLHKENLQPCSVFDKSGNLHLVWICSDGRNLRTVYSKRKNSPWPEGGWSTPEYVSDKGKNAYSPFILLAGQNVISLWQQVDGVLYRASIDQGNTWGSIEKQTTVKNLEEYALQFFTFDNEDTELITAFGSSAPQVTLTTAASLLRSVGLEDDLSSSSLMPINKKAVGDTAANEVSPKAKRFLLEYSDTRLTNRLMSQTIQSQEENLGAIHQEKEQLHRKIKYLLRELKSFKSLSEMHRKDAEGLRYSEFKLKEKVKTLESQVGNLTEEKLQLTMKLKELHNLKADFENNLLEIININSKLKDELESLKEAKKQLLEQLNAREQNETSLKNELMRCEGAKLLLEEKLHNAQHQNSKLEAFLANSQRLSEKPRQTSPEGKIPYKMLSTDTYE